MFTTKHCFLKPSLFNKNLRHTTSNAFYCNFQENSRSHHFNNGRTRPWRLYGTKDHTFSSLFTQNRRRYSKNIIDTNCNLDLKKIKTIFPEPRMTLNNLSAKIQGKAFDVYYKQHVLPKGAKKKSPQNMDWTCTYHFVWPEKMKFECTAISKRQASEAAATQALHWLTINKSIDTRGHPIIEIEKLMELPSSFDEPMQAKISEKSVERIGKIWEEYENVIQKIYQKAHVKANAKQNEVHEVPISKETRMDDDDLLEANNDNSIKKVLSTEKNYQEVEANAKQNEVDAIPISKETRMDDDVLLKANNDNSIKKVVSTERPMHPIYGRPMYGVSGQQELAEKRRRESLQRSVEYHGDSAAPLPVDEYKAEIRSAVQNHRVVIISGAAGCGKSTRIPLLLAQPAGCVLVAEPRRVAATGLADRVASELGEAVGVTVGYQVRLDCKPPRPPVGSILYCTSGILLNRLQTNPGLTGCSHVVIDEAHERDINTDISLLLLKRALSINRDLRLVVMSATLDTDVFTRYFGTKCPVIEVPGHAYPVEVSYLHDIQKKLKIKLPNTVETCQQDGKPQLNIPEIVDTIQAIDKEGKEGAILAFLPGWSEIKTAKRMLEEARQRGLYVVLPVHSRLSTADQTAMFKPPPPGFRKIVLATNVAETSVTIPDVTHVVDTGACKQNTLRAGPGHCYRLYTKEREKEFEEYTIPEIMRVPLEKTVLDCKSYAPDEKAQNFLAQLPEPPSDKAVELAIDELFDINALTPTEHLTRLGKALSTLQLSPRMGLSLVHAWVLGTAVAVSDLVASTDVEVFINSAERRPEIREIKRKYSATSDHMALWKLHQEFDETARGSNRELNVWCERYHVNKDRMAFVKSLSNLHLSQLLNTGLVETTLELEDMSRFSNSEQLSAGAVLSAVDALLLGKRVVKTKGRIKIEQRLFSTTGGHAHVSPESVNHAACKRPGRCLLAYTGGRHSAERRALLVNNTSAVSEHVALLFCRGRLDRNDINQETTILCLPKHKLFVNVPASQADTIIQAREMLWKTIQYHIDRDLKTLNYDEHALLSRFKIRLIKAIGKLLIEGHVERLPCNSLKVDVDD